MSLLDKIFKKNKDDNNDEIVVKEVKKEKITKALDKKIIKDEESFSNLEIKENDLKIKKAKKENEKQEVEIFQENVMPLKISKFLIKPLMTEKITNLAKNHKYVFEVAKEANKIELKKAIKDLYGVFATDVNIISIKGKKVGRMRRARGIRKNRKKAIITLKQGDSINIYGAGKDK